MRKNRIIVAAAFILLLFMLACAPAQDSGVDLSAMEAIDLSGEQVDSGIFQDYELTMINIWATYCGPCLNEMPDLGNMNRDYGDRSFQVVGIVTDVLNPDGSLSYEQVSLAYGIINATRADYRHLIPSASLAEAKLNTVAAVPETFFVDREGRQVGESYVGSRSRKEWENIVEELLRNN